MTRMQKKIQTLNPWGLHFFRLGKMLLWETPLVIVIFYFLQSQKYLVFNLHRMSHVKGVSNMDTA